jgi:hypothetical protein
MKGSDFQALLREKWGYSYDVQLRRIQQKVVLLVMWRYLEQPSFPLSEAEYLAHLENVLAHLQAWGVWESVRREIESTRQRLVWARRWPFLWICRRWGSGSRSGCCKFSGGEKSPNKPKRRILRLGKKLEWVSAQTADREFAQRPCPF